MRILNILTIILGACVSTTSIKTVGTISENNNDILILTSLIQDHLRKTNEQDSNLKYLVENDPLKRISKNFEKIDLQLRGGHISVYYKFSDSREINGIKLTDKEREITGRYRWTAKERKGEYDGEIRFDYGERFYRVIKIIENTQKK